MKKLLIYSLASIWLFGTSCTDFLVEEPKTQLTEEQVYGDQEKIELLVSGLYIQWRNTRKDRSALYMGVLGTDEGKQGGQQVHENNTQAALDKYNGALNPSNSTLSSEWSKRWPIVSAAAKAVKYATDAELKAQAAFLRAAVNFELAMYWGEIPIIDLDDMREARQPLQDVYEFIIADLKFAAENLPPFQEDLKLPTRGAANALLGKVYMYAPEESNVRNYEEAIKRFDLVIPKYSLIPNYADHFNTTLNQNSSEIIYAFQFTNIWPDNNQVQHHAGSRAVADTDGNTYFGGYDLGMPTEYYYKMESEGGVWEPGDTRRTASIRYDFTLPDGREPQPTWTGQADELEPHTKKFEDIRTQGVQNFWYSGGLIYYLRLSDIMLCKAECLNELGQTGAATQIVDEVRARAFGGTLPAEYSWSGMSQGEFSEEILDERMRELGFEGWRRMDLIRTGKLVELVSEHNPWAKAEGTISSYHVLYPIPESEILQNELINEEDQNTGY